MKLAFFLFAFVIGYSNASQCLVPTFLPTKCNGHYASIIIAGADGPNGKNGQTGPAGPRGPPGDDSPSCKHRNCKLHLSLFNKVMKLQEEVRKIDVQIDLLKKIDPNKLTKEELIKKIKEQKKIIIDHYETIEDLHKKIKDLDKKLKDPKRGVDPKKYKKIQKENEKKNKKIKELLEKIKKLHKKMKDCTEKDKMIAGLKDKIAQLAKIIQESGNSVKALQGLHNKLNKLKKKLSDKLKKLDKEVSKLKKQIKKKTKANSKLHQKIKELQAKLKGHQKAAESLLKKGKEQLKKKLLAATKKFKATDKHQKDIIKKLKAHLAALGKDTKGATLLNKKINELNKKIKDLEDAEKNLVFTTLNPKLAMMVVPKLDRKLYKRYIGKNGKITLPGSMGSDGSGPYVVMMKREDGKETFIRNIKDYQTGFGTLKGDSWLGLDILQALTCATKYHLRVELTDFRNKVYHANYKVFKIDEGYGYRIHTSGFSGNVYDALSLVEGQKFSTNDNDQDKSGRKSCAKKNGGWWYKNCKFGSLTGKYYKRPTRNRNGITWFDRKGKSHHNYSWKKAVMLVKPVHCSWRSRLTGKAVGKNSIC